VRERAEIEIVGKAEDKCRVEAFIIGRYLAVHPTWNGPGPDPFFGWTVTHRPTGFAIFEDLPDAERAIKAAEAIARLIPARSLAHFRKPDSPCPAQYARAISLIHRRAFGFRGGVRCA
jgi:hypothetical protein